MVAVGTLYGYTIRGEEVVEAIVIAERTPYRQFGLKVYALQVGGRETCLGRTPRVEAAVVDAVVAQRAEVVTPRLDVHGRVCRKWKDTCVVLAAQECRKAVYGELCPHGREPAQTECRLDFVVSLDAGRKTIQCG